MEHVTPPNRSRHAHHCEARGAQRHLSVRHDVMGRFGLQILDGDIGWRQGERPVSGAAGHNRHPGQWHHSHPCQRC